MRGHLAGEGSSLLWKPAKGPPPEGDPVLLAQRRAPCGVRSALMFNRHGCTCAEQASGSQKGVLQPVLQALSEMFMSHHLASTFQKQ